MKPLALVVLLAFAAVAGADGPQDLVAASKAAKSKKKSSTTKVITNADVKKSKGRLVEKPAPSAPVDPVPEQSSMERHQLEREARRALEEKLATADAKVVSLEKKLAAVEQEYYDENDLDRRDRDVVSRFEEVKKQLDEARVSRDTLAKQLNPPTTP